MSPAATHDRGLGSAYERYCVYQLLDRWARDFEARSLLEGPLDGMAGVAGVHGLGLARQGLTVVSAVDSADRVAPARALYDRFGAAGGTTATVVLASEATVSSLPVSDIVLSYHGLPRASDWRTHLRALASRARKALVVAVCNPDNWGFSAVRALGRLRGIAEFEPPEVWHTDALAPELWSLGRVREHVYFDCPWWPDLPVAPGQRLADRGLGLVSELGAGRRDRARAVSLAERFVYGPERWPYFGGPGWHEELLPALLRHPCFDGSPRLPLRRLAHLHAFVVDVRARRGVRLPVASP